MQDGLHVSVGRIQRLERVPHVLQGFGEIDIIIEPGEYDQEQHDAVRDVFVLTPRAIIEYLDLCRPIFKKTAAFGHFGRDEPEFTWEKTNKADIIREKAAI